MGVAVASIVVRAGTAITVFFAFTRPTRDSFPTVTQIAADPTTVTVAWRWSNGTTTTWTYGTGAQIAKLSTGVYVCTIPTRTAPSSRIIGTVDGAGAVTAAATFSVTVTPTSA